MLIICIDHGRKKIIINNHIISTIFSDINEKSAELMTND